MFGVSHAPNDTELLQPTYLVPIANLFTFDVHIFACWQNDFKSEQSVTSAVKWIEQESER